MAFAVVCVILDSFLDKLTLCGARLTMKFQKTLSLCFFSLAMFFASSHTPLANEKQPSQAQVQRVGGDFIVERIDAQQDGSFRITFQHSESTRHKTLVLVSDHVHMGVEEGQKLRISAEVLAEYSDYTEVAQVLLFLPSEYGKTPVWMLSQKSPKLSLDGVKLLEMHAPSADYAIY